MPESSHAPQLLSKALRIVDIILTATAFFIAYLLKKYVRLPVLFTDGLIEGPGYHIVLLMILIIWYLLLEMTGVYTIDYKKRFLSTFLTLIKGIVGSLFVLIVAMYVWKIKDVSRVMIGLFFLLDIGFLTLLRWWIYRSHHKRPKSEYYYHNVLIIGSKERAKDVLFAVLGRNAEEDTLRQAALDQDVMREKLPQYRVLGCLDVDKSRVGMLVHDNIHVIGTVDDLKELLLSEAVDELVVAIPLNLIENAEDYVALAGKLGVPVRIIPDWQVKNFIHNPAISEVGLEVFSGLATIVLSANRPIEKD